MNVHFIQDFGRIAILLLACLVVSVNELCANERVAFKVEGRGYRHANLSFKDGQMLMGLGDGKEEIVPWQDFEGLVFNAKHDPMKPEPPRQEGLLAEPWKHANIGPMVAGGSAHGTEGEMNVFTSRRPSVDSFRSFSMAYKEGPDNGHITARVRRIGHGNHESRAGVVIRDGTGMGAGNFILVVHPGTGASFHAWRIANGYSGGDFESNIRPPYWVRLVREEGLISAFISPDGNVWTKIRELEEKVILGSRRKKSEPPSFFGVCATASSGETPWAATFDNISVGPLSDLESDPWFSAPRITLIDGSVVRCEVSTNEKGTLIKLGAPWNRTLPMLYVSKIDFYYPLTPEKRKRKMARPGVSLKGGDIFEGTFETLSDGKVVLRSALLGRREIEIGEAAESVFIREENPDRRGDFKVETKDGQIFYAKDIGIDDGRFVFKSAFIGEKKVTPSILRRITHRSLFKDNE